MTKGSGRKSRSKQQHSGGTPLDDESPISGRHDASDRRPLRFWQPFNDWWRAELERLGRRPNAQEIHVWYAAHAAGLWGDDSPSLQETRVHAKCLRSLPLVRDYFRNYRAKKRSVSERSGSLAPGDEGDYGDGPDAHTPLHRPGPHRLHHASGTPSRRRQRPDSDDDDSDDLDMDPSLSMRGGRGGLQGGGASRTLDGLDGGVLNGYQHDRDAAAGLAQLASLAANGEDGGGGGGAGGLSLELLAQQAGGLPALLGGGLGGQLWPGAGGMANGGSGEQSAAEQLLRGVALQQLQQQAAAAAAVQQQFALAALAQNIALSRHAGSIVQALSSQQNGQHGGPGFAAGGGAGGGGQEAGNEAGEEQGKGGLLASVQSVTTSNGRGKRRRAGVGRRWGAEEGYGEDDAEEERPQGFAAMEAASGGEDEGAGPSGRGGGGAAAGSFWRSNAEQPGSATRGRGRGRGRGRAADAGVLAGALAVAEARLSASRREPPGGRGPAAGSTATLSGEQPPANGSQTQPASAPMPDAAGPGLPHLSLLTGRPGLGLSAASAPLSVPPLLGSEPLPREALLTLGREALVERVLVLQVHLGLAQQLNMQLQAQLQAAAGAQVGQTGVHGMGAGIAAGAEEGLGVGLVAGAGSLGRGTAAAGAAKGRGKEAQRRKAEEEDEEEEETETEGGSSGGERGGGAWRGAGAKQQAPPPRATVGGGQGVSLRPSAAVDPKREPADMLGAGSLLGLAPPPRPVAAGAAAAQQPSIEEVIATLEAAAAAAGPVRVVAPPKAREEPGEGQLVEPPTAKSAVTMGPSTPRVQLGLALPGPIVSGGVLDLAAGNAVGMGMPMGVTPAIAASSTKPALAEAEGGTAVMAGGTGNVSGAGRAAEAAAREAPAQPALPPLDLQLQQQQQPLSLQQLMAALAGAGAGAGVIAGLPAVPAAEAGAAL